MWLYARLLVLIAFCFYLSGCGILQCKLCAKKFGEGEGGSSSSAGYQSDYYPGINVEPVTISVTGFGAPDAQIANLAQRQLLAMRASEVDAYRRLAEQVKGVQVSANTKVIDFVTSHDHIRSIVDSYIRSAKIGTQGMTRNGYYETTLTLKLDGDFFNRLRYESGKSAKVGLNNSMNDSSDRVANITGINSKLSISLGHYDLGLVKN